MQDTLLAEILSPFSGHTPTNTCTDCRPTRGTISSIWYTPSLTRHLQLVKALIHETYQSTIVIYMFYVHGDVCSRVFKQRNGFGEIVFYTEQNSIISENCTL